MPDTSDAVGRGGSGALGAPIAAGRTAEVFAFGEGRILKLLRPEFPARLGESEATVAALVASVYPGAPRCLGTVEIDRRFGLIYERIDGPSMDDVLNRSWWRIDRLARTFAALHASMHAANGTGLAAQQLAMQAALDRAAPNLPPGAHEAAVARLGHLPTGTSVCHGDLHPGNVLLAPDRAVVIDWENARCGNPVADVARALYLVRDTPLGDPSNAALRLIVRAARRRFASVYLARYRALRPLDETELRAWRLPILAARMAEGIEAERSFLESMIEREVAGLAGC